MHDGTAAEHAPHATAGETIDWGSLVKRGSILRDLLGSAVAGLVVSMVVLDTYFSYSAGVAITLIVGAASLTLSAGVLSAARQIKTLHTLPDARDDLAPDVRAVLEELAARCRVDLQRVISGRSMFAPNTTAGTDEPDLSVLTVKELRAESYARHNAAWVTTGLRARRGVLVVGDAYRDNVELARGAIAHELGHAQHPTLLYIYGKYAASLAFRVALLVTVLFHVTASGDVSWGGSVLFAASWVAATFVLRLMLSYLSRRAEHAADRFAAELVGTETVTGMLTHLHLCGFGQDRDGLHDNLFDDHPFMHKRLRHLTRRDRSREQQPGR